MREICLGCDVECASRATHSSHAADNDGQDAPSPQTHEGRRLNLSWDLFPCHPPYYGGYCLHEQGRRRQEKRPPHGDRSMTIDLQNRMNHVQVSFAARHNIHRSRSRGAVSLFHARLHSTSGHHLQRRSPTPASQSTGDKGRSDHHRPLLGTGIPRRDGNGSAIYL